MSKRLRNTICLLGVWGLVGVEVSAFTLSGPPLGHHTDVFGYGRRGASLSFLAAPDYGPANLGEEYRINVPNLYYAVDASFLDYFGARGSQEVDKAVQYFNELPDFSTMSENLSEFPLDTTRENFRAGSLQLTDLKSFLMTAILEQMGLMTPEISVRGVQSRVLPQGAECPNYNFYIIQRNFDPVTWEPSSYVNGALFTMSMLIQCAPAPDASYIVPVPVDPLAFTFRSVAGFNYFDGSYLSGLTRDDIGGLRYLYRRDNYNLEQMPPDVLAGLGGGGGSPWTPVDPNVTNEPAGDTTALRAGLGKVNFIKRNYDSLLGNFFVGLTNNFSVQIVTNGTLRSQTFSRAVLQPDLVFSAANLTIDVGGPTITVYDRTTPEFASATAAPDLNGPGSLVVGGSRGSISIRVQKIGPAFSASNPNFISEAALQPLWRWGSFDGSTNEPVVYPSGASIKELERLVLQRN